MSEYTQQLLQQAWEQVKHNTHKIWGSDDAHVRARIDRVEQEKQKQQQQQPATTTPAGSKEPGQWQSGAVKHPFLWSEDKQTMHVMPSDLRTFIARERYEKCSIKDIMKTYAIQACEEANLLFDPTKEWAISADDSTPGNTQADAEALLLRLPSPISCASASASAASSTVSAVAGAFRQLGHHRFIVTDEGDGITTHRCELCTVSYIQGPAQEFAHAMAMPFCPGLIMRSSATNTTTTTTSSDKDEPTTTSNAAACVVCNKKPAHACKGCNSGGHGVTTLYCTRECQQAHHKIHKSFCKEAHVYLIPRYCEHCRAQTTLGCKTCKMPFCSAQCYSAVSAQAKHKRGCGPIPSPAELALLIKMPDTVTLPTIKQYNAPLMFIPRAWQFQGAESGMPSDTSFNVFQLGTDSRIAIRDAFPHVAATAAATAAATDMHKEQAEDSTIFVEDYMYVMRLFVRRVLRTANAADAVASGKSEQTRRTE